MPLHHLFLATAHAMRLLPYAWSGTPTTLRFHAGGPDAIGLFLPLN